MTWKGQRQKVIALYAKSYIKVYAKSKAGHEKSCLKIGGPSSKAKYS